jgi:hypothetical protein
VKIETEAAVGIDMAVEQRRESSAVVGVEAIAPDCPARTFWIMRVLTSTSESWTWWSESNTDLLVVRSVRGHLAALAEVDEIVGAVPVLDHIQTLAGTLAGQTLAGQTEQPLSH